MEKPYRVFCCYAREDQQFLHDLKTHLMPLERRGLMTVEADINISAGMEWEPEIHHHLETADITLLLISPHFIASDYCFNSEMQQAIARHEQRTARVVPIIIRPTAWQGMPFSKLQMLPKDANPVSKWQDKDDAFLSITEGIRRVVQELENPPPITAPPPSIPPNIRNPPRPKIDPLQTIEEALLDSDYGMAAEEITRVKPSSSEMPIHEQAKLKYLEALVRLKGKRPCIHKFTVIKEIERLLSGASKYHNLHSYTCILAIIEYDFGNFNGFSMWKEKAKTLRHKASTLTRVDDDDANIKLLSRVQPDLCKEYAFLARGLIYPVW